jgi:putative inorganic carbon (hco3(-)) transporter
MLRTIFVLVILAGGMIAAFFSRFAALLLYLWFALFRPQEFLWFDISAYRLSLVVGLLLVVPCFLTGIWPNATSPLSIGSILFLLSGLVAQSGAFNSEIGWAWIDYLARLILVCLLAVTLINTQKRFLWAIAVISGSFGLLSAKAGLASLAGGGLQYAAGLAGAFIDNNGYALGIAMILPLLIATGQNLHDSHPAERWLKYGFYIAAPLSAFAIISTFSRAGFLALAAGSVILIFLQKRGTGILIALGIILAIAFPFIPIPEGYLDRVQTIGTYDEVHDTSAISRFHFWRVATNMALDHPLGVGLKNFESAYDQYDFLGGFFGQGRSVHSSHFQVLAEMGFPGAIIWTAMFAYAFNITFKIRNRSQKSSLSPENQHFFYTCSNALIASMIAFIIGGAFIALALNDLTWLTFALITSLDRLFRRAVAEVNSAPQETVEPAA